MRPEYCVRNLVFESGERFSLLVDKTTGIPLFEPTLFALTVLRAKNRASDTIAQVNRSIKVAKQTLDHHGIDLDARLAEGRILATHEIDSFLSICSMRQSDIDALPANEVGSATASRRVASLESARMKATTAATEERVKRSTAGIRFYYGGAYIVWHARRRLLDLGLNHSTRAGLADALKELTQALDSRAPGGDRDSIHQRMGLTEAQTAQLLKVVDPTSDDNPWRGSHIRDRNFLIVMWLLNLGIRKGELLGIRISDVNFQSNEVLIARRPDEKTDPRKYQPKTKTNDRLLGLSEDLSALTRRYILKYRKAQGGSKKHPYLFVANGTGAPLTLVAVNKVFQQLRAKCPGLPDELTPHQLRHTWNDRFSEEMDLRRIDPVDEERQRAYQMGWKSGSKSAKTYTRRHVVRESTKAARSLQGKHKVKKMGIKNGDANR